MTTPGKRHKLTKIRLSEISVVDVPAEKNSVFSVWKRGNQEENGSVTDLDKVLKQVEEATGKLTDMQKALDAAETRAAEADKRAAVAEQKAIEVAKAVGTTPATADSTDDILKGISDPKLAAAFAKLAADNKTANDALAKMDEQRAIAKAVDVVKADFSHLSLQADEFGKVWRRAAMKLDADDFTEIARVLKSADAMAEMALAGRLGFIASTPTSAEAALTKAAEDIQKADSSVPFAKAYQMACERNPALYNQYRNEKFPRAN